VSFVLARDLLERLEASEAASLAELQALRRREPWIFSQDLDISEGDLDISKSIVFDQMKREDEACREAETGASAGTRGLPTVPRWLIVFDFDRTIAREHMWGTYRDAPLEAIPMSDQTFVDIAALRAVVGSIRGHGGQVAVATFGRADVAGKALRFAFGPDHGIHITTPADYPDPGHRPVDSEGGAAGKGKDLALGGAGKVSRCPEGSSWLGNKNRQLVALAKMHGVAASDMMLLDDDAHNIQEALKAGVDARHTPAGLTKAVLDKVEKDLGLLPLRT